MIFLYPFQWELASFQEKVQAITLDDFLELLKISKLTPINFLGDYHLNEFDPELSDRLIIIAKK